MKTKASNPRAVAIYARNELLMLLMICLVILPWRQRNIRDCKVIGGDSNSLQSSGRSFQHGYPAFMGNGAGTRFPGASFWQIRFVVHETKTKNEVHAFLPSELVPLLEEYLSIHRRVLVGNSDDLGTLFVNDAAGLMNVGQVRNLVKKLASAHAGVC